MNLQINYSGKRIPFRKKVAIMMALHPFDTVEFHGQLCIVDAVWEDGVPYCSLRPWDGRPGEYFVEQKRVALVLDINDFFEKKRRAA